MDEESAGRKRAADEIDLPSLTQSEGDKAASEEGDYQVSEVSSSGTPRSHPMSEDNLEVGYYGIDPTNGEFVVV